MPKNFTVTAWMSDARREVKMQGPVNPSRLCFGRELVDYEAVGRKSWETRLKNRLSDSNEVRALMRKEAP